VAIAFMAMSTALAGFALSFRATLIRGTADQAADQVPLDALIAAGPTFATPLELASSSQWRALSHGMVFAVRRTSATFLSGSGSVTVSMLGVPADAIAGIHGWRASDGSAPLHVLAKRLRPIGPTRTAGPLVPGDTRSIALDGGSRRLDLLVMADLRNPQGLTRPLSLGTIGPGRGFVRGVLPAGRWEVEALELDESAGLAVTNGHQNGESPAPATQFAARVTLGPLIARDGRGHVVMRASLAGWRGVGAAASTGYGRLAASLVFQESGFPGVLRPSQPSDHRALPVLADPATATAAGPGGRIGLTVDDLPLQARIVGVLRRFPTIAAGAAGFIVAGEPALSDALDAQLPGQGRPDELWISTPQTHDLQAGLAQGPLAQLSASFRAPIERALRSQPLAAGVMRTLLVAGGLAAALAVLGMLLILGGPFRDRRIESDLETQGLGPGALRRELRWRVGLAAIAGIWPGLVIAVLVDRLAVSSVGAVESGAPEPPLVTVVPWLELLGLGVAVTLLCLLLGWASTARSFSNRRGRPPAPAAPSRGVTELVEDVVR
jgi:hypothetical protein